ncbi:phospholipase D-like domain-containing protein [Bacillus sp. REN10]|uniref:phospholipase D-like domain-containing protein n=1 Tax=Bacillus sp. REN10 TaxID=2782541 RepID=UPI00193C6B27|nr:phospholipase D-like domain-containing protein [Bacillus sp. REN10]
MWFIFCLFLLFIFIFADLYFGERKARNQPFHKSYPERKGSIDFFSSGPVFFDQLFTDIKKAKQRVACLFYIVKDDECSQAFFALLKEKAKNGVEVYLLMDWLGSHKVKTPMINDLKQAGIHVDFSCKPRLPFLLFSIQRRNHRKITVIDDNIGYLGGFNVGREYMNQSEKPALKPWRDYHLRFTGAAVQDLESEFLDDWNQEKRPFVQPICRESDYEEGITHTILPCKNGVLTEQLASLIAATEQSIFIGSPYFIPSKPVFQQLIAALERGVTVTVLLPAHADHPLVKQAAYPYLRKMLYYPNAHVHLFNKGFYHAKMIIFDNRVCDIGTANFDQRSQLINWECNCLIDGPLFMNSIEPVIQKDILNSETLTLDGLTHLSIQERIKEQIAKVVRKYL